MGRISHYLTLEGVLDRGEDVVHGDFGLAVVRGGWFALAGDLVYRLAGLAGVGVARSWLVRYAAQVPVLQV